MKVPSVNTNAAGSDSVIYIYYGNTSIAQSVESATGVWDSNYLLVHHLKESSGTLNDSTQYNRDSSAQTGLTYAATGKIGSSLLFDEVDDHYTIADFAYGDTFTVSMWLKVTDNTGSLYQYFYSHDGSVPSFVEKEKRRNLLLTKQIAQRGEGGIRREEGYHD